MGEGDARMNVRRVGLRVFLGLIGFNALLAMGIVLIGDLGDREWKILGTSLVLTGAVLVGLAALAARDQPGFQVLSLVGAGTAAVSGATWIIGIWGEIDGEGLWKFSGTLQIIALAIACAGILSLATLPKGSAWLTLAAYAVISALALLAIGGIWGELGNSVYLQIIGVLSIALAALAIVIPVVHRTARREQPVAVGETAGGAPSVNFCPRCGVATAGRPDQPVTCTNCHTVFTVTF